MSYLPIFYYQNGKKPIRIDEITNAFAWVHGLQALFAKDELFVGKYEELRKAYNAFQGSDAPKWMKVAVAFQGDYSLVLDEDRNEAADALRRAFRHVTQQDDSNMAMTPSILQVADLFTRLEPGSLVVLSHDDVPIEGVLCEQRVSRRRLESELEKLSCDPERSWLESWIDANCKEDWKPVSRLKQELSRPVLAPIYWP